MMWCEGCDWNLDAGQPPVALKRHEARAQRSAERAATRLREEMLSPAAGLRKRPWSRPLSLGLAITIHLPGAVLLATGGWIIWINGLQFWSAVAALALLALAVVLRPRLGSVPRHWPVLTRDKAPALFGLLDEVTSAEEARPVEWVACELEYNASTSIVGLRRRRLITIGLPLWIALTNQERVAMLAHEVAHDINGDLTHSLVVGSALDLLAAVRRLINPPRTFHAHDNSIFAFLTAFSEWLARLLMLALRSFVDSLFWLLLRLSRAASPKAEYLADDVAARVASADALATCLDKLLIGRPVLQFLWGAVSNDAQDVWAAVSADVAGFSPKERERQRRLARRAGHRVDVTHPPTIDRIDVVRRIPHATPLVTIDDNRARAIHQDLEPAMRRLAAMLASSR